MIDGHWIIELRDGKTNCIILLSTTSSLYESMQVHISSLLLLQDLSCKKGRAEYSRVLNYDGENPGLPESLWATQAEVPHCTDSPSFSNDCFQLLHHRCYASCWVPCQEETLSQLHQSLHTHFCYFTTSKSLRLFPLSMVLLQLCPCRQLRFYCRGMRKCRWPWWKQQGGYGGSSRMAKAEDHALRCGCKSRGKMKRANYSPSQKRKVAC